MEVKEVKENKRGNGREGRKKKIRKQRILLCKIWSSYRGGYEALCSPLQPTLSILLLVHFVLRESQWQPARCLAVPSCFIYKPELSAKGFALLAACFMLVSFLAYYLILKMAATFSSETSFDFQRTTRHYIPEDKTPPRILFCITCTLYL
jgi:hypothetical protein